MIPQQLNMNNTEISQNHTGLLELERVRKENDQLRKKLASSVQQKFKKLKLFAQTQQTNNYLNNVNEFTSEQYVQKLATLLKQLSELTQMQIKDINEQQIEINQAIKQKQRILKEITDRNEQGQNDVLKLTSIIQEKKQKLSQLQDNLQIILQQSRQIKEQLIDKRLNQYSVDEMKKRRLEENWQMQKSYITALLDERTRLKQQFVLLEKANKILEQKSINHHNQLTYSLERKQKIEELKIQNSALFNQLNQQKSRRQNLQELKLTLVINKQSNEATNIVQKWDEEKRNCQNLLLTIIQRVNRQLPFKKLDDVNEIIKAAQNYIRRQSQNRRQNHPQQMMIEQNQPQQYQN